MNPLAWQPLIDGMIEAVWIVEPLELRIVAANRAAETLLGSAREHLLGSAIVDLAVTPEDICFWEDVASGHAGQIYSETLMRRSDGEILHVDRRASLVKLSPEVSVYVVCARDQSDQRRVEDELEKLLAEMRATLESTADGILVADLQGGIRGYNQHFADLWDLRSDLLTGRDDAAIYEWMAQCAADRANYLDRLGVISRTPLMEATDVIVLRSGRVVERVSMPQYARGRPIGRVFSFRDITQRLADEARLKLASKVFDSSLDAILVMDGDYRIIAANPSSERLTGYAAEKIVGLMVRDVIFDLDSDDFTPRMEAKLVSDGFWEDEIWFRRLTGAACPGLVSLVQVPGDDGGSPQYICFLKDLSERLEAKRRIEELAYNDALTGLPNRTLLNERIEHALSVGERNGRPFGVLFLDLDRFKQINDSLGHVFGDRVLVQISERIKRCLRQADTAARLGGDEFVLLLHDADVRGAEITANRLLEELAKPLVLDEMNFMVTGSIGIALYPDDGRSADDLIKNADTAMYRVKERGRSGFRFYQRQMNIDLLNRMKLDTAMRKALEAGGFRLHFQPQVEIGSGRIIGAEALIRWRDEELGDISPGRFIPVAEESGLIVALGNWVLRQAVVQAMRWYRQGYELVMAINVSALQFQQPDFVDSVAAAIEAEGLPAARLEVELTESILVHDADEALVRLNALARLGVRISIDDFGTGYSSLMYLKRFPIQKLKIDRSFVNGLPDDESDVAIAAAIINLARALKLDVIAEGVETHAQRDFLLDAGCGQFQGFLCSPALDVPAFELLLDEIAGIDSQARA